MQANEAKRADVDALARSLAGAVRVGRVMGCSLQGLPVVDYPGNTRGPLAARVATTCDCGPGSMPPSDAEVLLVFDSGDPARPIVLGMLGSQGDTTRRPTPKVERHLRVDADTFDLEGQRQLTLRCGKSSISLFADGRIVLKGTRLLSRASEINKIKGAVVALN